MNNVECCNLALSRIGHGSLRQLSSLDENTEQGQACARVFSSAFAAVLAEFSWPWARASVALALCDFDAPSGWAYAYAYPSDATGIRFVESEDFVPDWLGLHDQRSHWEVMANPSADGKIIVADFENAWAYYHKAVTDLTFADELFADALAWRVAGEIALGLRADAKISQLAGQQYTAALDKAVARAMNERGGFVRPAAESIVVREAGNAGRNGPTWGYGS